MANLINNASNVANALTIQIHLVYVIIKSCWYKFQLLFKHDLRIKLGVKWCSLNCLLKTRISAKEREREEGRRQHSPKLELNFSSKIKPLQTVISDWALDYWIDRVANFDIAEVVVPRVPPVLCSNPSLGFVKEKGPEMYKLKIWSYYWHQWRFKSLKWK